MKRRAFARLNPEGLVVERLMALNAVKRPLLVAVGWLCVGLGFLGIVMPLFPTTPFLLIAVWAFSKSSPELAERIRTHRLAGPYIRDWQDHGVIPPTAKVLAVTMMAGFLAYLHWASVTPWWATLAIGLVLLAVSGYIVTRPGRSPGARSELSPPATAADDR